MEVNAIDVGCRKSRCVGGVGSGMLEADSGDIYWSVSLSRDVNLRGLEIPNPDT